MTISAKLIEVSNNLDNNYIITMELEYPRFFHSEFMTHRQFSRNASSNRAMPTERILGDIFNNPAMPIHWGKNKAGMQASEAIRSLIDGLGPEQAWTKLSREVSKVARMFSEAGYHKQVVNRLIEPFQHIRVIVTATEWDNFFSLRCHPDAQPEIRELAEKMRDIRDNVMMGWCNTLLTPMKDWHLPYIRESEKAVWDVNTLLKCSVARCARVSYLTHNNITPSIEKDMELYTKLAESRHMSPFEHQATCINPEFSTDTFGYHTKQSYGEVGITHCDLGNNLWSGNFKGFAQFRKIKEYNDDQVSKQRAEPAKDTTLNLLDI